MPEYLLELILYLPTCAIPCRCASGIDASYIFPCESQLKWAFELWSTCCVN